MYHKCTDCGKVIKLSQVEARLNIRRRVKQLAMFKYIPKERWHPALVSKFSATLDRIIKDIHSGVAGQN